jgi:hypothetical protein
MAAEPAAPGPDAGPYEVIVDDHVIPQACVHVIPQVLAYACFT